MAEWSNVEGHQVYACFEAAPQNHITTAMGVLCAYPPVLWRACPPSVVRFGGGNRLGHLLGGGAADGNITLLIGVLKDDASATLQGISELLSTLKQKTGKDDPTEAIKAGKVCGFTICPPRGSELIQEKIEADTIRSAVFTYLASRFHST